MFSEQDSSRVDTQTDWVMAPTQHLPPTSLTVSLWSCWSLPACQPTTEDKRGPTVEGIGSKLVLCSSNYLLASFHKSLIFSGLEGVRKMIHMFCNFQGEMGYSKPSKRTWLIWLVYWGASWMFPMWRVGMNELSGLFLELWPATEEVMYTCHNKVRNKR